MFPLRCDGCRNGVSRAWEREEERVSLHVDLDAIALAERVADDSAVSGQDLGVAVTETFEELGRSFDIREHEGDRSSGQVSHGRIVRLPSLSELLLEIRNHWPGAVTPVRDDRAGQIGSGSVQRAERDACVVALEHHRRPSTRGARSPGRTGSRLSRRSAAWSSRRPSRTRRSDPRRRRRHSARTSAAVV